MIFIHGGIYNICRSVAPQFIKIQSYTNVSYANMDAHHWWSLNDRFSRLTSHSLETDVCLFHALSQSVKNFIIAELNNHYEKTMPFGVKISL